MSNPDKVAMLRAENQTIQAKIQQFQKQKMSSFNLKGEIQKFTNQSQKNINDMTAKISQENQSQNLKLKQLTTEYQSLLKNQIKLLTLNKELSEKKEKQDKLFDELVETLSTDYETKIKQFENKVKKNVKRIQEMSGSNIIKRLLKNDKFKEEMKGRDINLQVLEKQSLLEDISGQVEELQQEISKAELKSQSLDEQLTKTRELITTMKELLENMVKEKENIVRQNLLLKEKLRQSEKLIEQLLGTGGEQNEYKDDFEPEGNDID